MRKYRIAWVAGILLAAGVCAAPVASGAETAGLGTPLPEGSQLAGWEGKLRIFEGVKEGAPAAAKVVTSSFLKYAFTVNLESDLELASELAQVKKIFNLQDVRLLTESDLSWKKGLPPAIAHVFRLDHKEYMIKLTTSAAGDGAPVRIEVFEQRETEKAGLLDTAFDFPKTEKNAIIFGFEDTQGQPYFLSLRFTNLSAVKAVKAKKDVKPPKLVKSVPPVYPEDAKKAGKEGIVIIEATTGVDGKVASAKILKPVDPELDQAALDAVKQWTYEPMLINGQPKGVVFTVTIRFSLKDKNDKGVLLAARSDAEKKEWEKKLQEFTKGSVKAEGDIKPPKLVKEVAPVYPEDARQQGIQGVVILSVKTDESGRVVDTMILRSVPALDEAARAAVRQWTYEPMTIDGKPVSIVFTVTVNFRLQ